MILKILIISLIFLCGCSPYNTKFYKRSEKGRMVEVYRIEQDILGSSEGDGYKTDTRTRPFLSSILEKTANLSVLKEVNN